MLSLKDCLVNTKSDVLRVVWERPIFSLWKGGERRWILLLRPEEGSGPYWHIVEFSKSADIRPPGADLSSRGLFFLFPF